MIGEIEKKRKYARIRRERERERGAKRVKDPDEKAAGKKEEKMKLESPDKG